MGFGWADGDWKERAAPTADLRRLEVPVLGGRPGPEGLMECGLVAAGGRRSGEQRCEVARAGDGFVGKDGDSKAGCRSVWCEIATGAEDR